MEKNTKIGILGAGIEGLAVAEYLTKHGFKNVTIFDERKSTLKVDLPQNTFKVGFGGIFGCEVLFRSPGIHTKRLDEARERGIKVTSTIQYFFENCPCKIIGVTGTKGKGTTSSLIYEILKADGKDVYLGGNIGSSPLTFLDDLNPFSWVVLELSSFQLQDLTISPHVAVVLMTTSDHLDYHADRDEYLEAKMPILRYQNDADFCVLNKDYDYVERFSGLGKGRKFFVSRKSEVDNGAYVKDERVYFVEGAERDFPKNTLKVEKPNQKTTLKVNSENTFKVICETGEVALLGEHNLENVMPAVCVARILGVSIPVIRKVVYSFRGLEHRLEFVREVGGVKYYNDSFSTTPETSVAAAYAFKGPVFLIAGGSEKNSDFKEWAYELQKNPNLKMVILTGYAVADRMEKCLKDAAAELKGLRKSLPQVESLPPAPDGLTLEEPRAAEVFDKSVAETMYGLGEFPLKVVRCVNLKEALKVAAENAVPGDNVVMSPAAASFEEFENYKYRGAAFRKIVGEL